MYLGPLSDTDGSCYGVERSSAINLFRSPEQGSCMQAAHRQWLWEWWRQLQSRSQVHLQALFYLLLASKYNTEYI